MSLGSFVNSSLFLSYCFMKYCTFIFLVSSIFGFLFSSFCLAQIKTIEVPDGKYFVDRYNKIILCTEKIADLGGPTRMTEIVIKFDTIYNLPEGVQFFSYSESYDLQRGGDPFKLFFTKLPVFSITTSSDIVDDPKVPATLTYTDSSGLVLSSFIGIEYRGGWSQTLPKKNYDIEFWKDVTGRETVDVQFGNMRSDDDWILDALYNEPVRINSYTAHKLWLDVHTLYYANKSPKARSGADVAFAELFLNGQYQGIYMLSEQVDRKQLDLKKTTTKVEGELIKGVEWGNASTFLKVNPYDNSSVLWDGLEMKYPDEVINWENIYSFVDFVVNSRNVEFKRSIHERFTIDNAIDYFLFMNLLGAADNTGKNIYMCKYKAGEPYFFVPWDLDGTYGTNWEGKRLYSHDFILSNRLFARLIKLNPGDFLQKAVSRWFELRGATFSNHSIAENLDRNYSLLRDNNVYAREMMVWANYTFSAGDLTFMKEWMDRRLEYLDDYFAGVLTSDDSEGTEAVLIFPNPTSDFLIIDCDGDHDVPFSLGNLQGAVLKSGTFFGGRNFLNTYDLESGVYVLIVGDTFHKVSVVK